MTELQNKKDYIKRKYYESKTTCPQCGGREFADTEIQPLPIEVDTRFRDTKNKTACRKCGWTGYIDQLR